MRKYQIAYTVGYVLTAVLCLLSALVYASAQEVRCYSPDEIIAKAPTGLHLSLRMEGEELKQFNAHYTEKFGREVNNDLVLVFEYDADGDEHDTVWITSFTNGCIDSRPAQMKKEMFNILHDGQNT